MKPIAVLGCLPSLPESFPVSFEENSGNMVHAVAPLKMYYPWAIHSENQYWKISGEMSFRNFVNRKCSHLIITLANILRLGRKDGRSYSSFKKSLEQYRVPFVVFGLGVQGADYNIDEAYLCEEAIDLVRFLSKNSVLLGCRGNYTKQVLEKLCGVDNAYVTGCPSFFSNPKGFEDLFVNVQAISDSDEDLLKPAFCITGAHNENERNVLINGIKENIFQIEPVMKSAYEYYLLSKSNKKNISVPYFLKESVKNNLLTPDEIRDFYSRNFMMFRCPSTWEGFLKESVSFSYGSRFHCNMQSILSGRPAVWFTHDARTQELVDYLNLPNLSLVEASSLNVDDIRSYLKYDSFFNGLNNLFSRFNYYLRENGLPEIESPSV